MISDAIPWPWLIAMVCFGRVWSALVLCSNVFHSSVLSTKCVSPRSNAATDDDIHTPTTAIIIMQRTFRWLAATNDHPVVPRWTSAYLRHISASTVMVSSRPGPVSGHSRSDSLHRVDKWAWNGTQRK